MQDWTKQLTINFSPFLVGQRPYGKQSSLETSATVGTPVQTFDHGFYDPKEFTSLDFLIRASYIQNTVLICQVISLCCRLTCNDRIKHETPHGINQAKLNFVFVNNNKIVLVMHNICLNSRPIKYITYLLTYSMVQSPS